MGAGWGAGTSYRFHDPSAPQHEQADLAAARRFIHAKCAPLKRAFAGVDTAALISCVLLALILRIVFRTIAHLLVLAVPADIPLAVSGGSVIREFIPAGNPCSRNFLETVGSAPVLYGLQVNLPSPP